MIAKHPFIIYLRLDNLFFFFLWPTYNLRVYYSSDDHTWCTHICCGLFFIIALKKDVLATENR